MASESSSEDENLEKFSDIVQCVTLGLQQSAKNDSTTNSKCTTLQNIHGKKQSLRCWREEQELVKSSHNFIITPEVKKHMARKLTNYLDSSIKWRDKNIQVQVQNACKFPEEKIGVYLLSASKEILQSADEKVVQPSKKRTNSMSTSSESSDDGEMARLAEAAVSGYTIMKNCNSSREKDDNVPGKREIISEGESKDHDKRKKKRKKKKKKKERDKDLRPEEN